MKNMRKNEGALFQCAEFILPWLHSSELASVASTCKTLNLLTKSITFTRCSDASRNLENLPIPFVNAVDHHPYAYFFYTPTQILALDDDPSHFRQPWGDYPISGPVIFRRQTQHTGSSCNIRSKLDLHLANQFLIRVEGANGCDCERCDADSGCPCSDINLGELTWECGPSCRCALECGNRVSQRGIGVRLKIVKDSKKGWGLHAGELIREGQFVCEYAGELLTTKEARMRQQMYDELTSGGQFSAALLVVREHLPSGNAFMQINIDGTRIGNVARFINHSCDGGNLSTTLVRYSGSLLPRLCFFASRPIQENEELTFSYGDIRLKPKGLPCFCASSCCFGALPSENI